MESLSGRRWNGSWTHSIAHLGLIIFVVYISSKPRYTHCVPCCWYSLVCRTIVAQFSPDRWPELARLPQPHTSHPTYHKGRPTTSRPFIVLSESLVTITFTCPSSHCAVTMISRLSHCWISCFNNDPTLRTLRNVHYQTKHE